MQNIVHIKNEIKDFFLNFIFFFSDIGLFGCSTGANLYKINTDKTHRIGDKNLIVAVLKVFIIKIKAESTHTSVSIHPQCVSAWYPPAYILIVTNAVKLITQGINSLKIKAIIIAIIKLKIVDNNNSIP